jgi:hypothetical protein
VSPLTKKTTTKPDKSEIDHLDDAVSELSKQTEALLGKSGEKVSVKNFSQPKPELPKKLSLPKKRGFHFDIIPGTSKTQLNPTFKATAAMPAQKLLEAEYDDELDHEQSTPKVATAGEPANQSGSESGSSLISGHATGSLHVGELEAPDKSKSETRIPASASVKLKAPTIQLSEHEPKTHNQPQSHDDTTTEAFENDEVPLKDAHPEDTDNEKEAAENIKIDNEGTIKTDEPAKEGGHEVYANNLVKDTQPKGFQQHPGQQKPTVFDTNEYHPPLHDWSTLEHRSPAMWFIAGGALLGAAALFYLFIVR